MNILFLYPRLDCSFKPGPVPANPGPPNHPIRLHWQRFIEGTVAKLRSEGHKVDVIHRPLWQMTYDIIRPLAEKYDVVYVPHKEKAVYPIDNALYYMQTVFPRYFTVDPIGWGAHLSYLPLDLDGEHENIFDSLRSEQERNVSKFAQPQKELDIEAGFVLFVCQIPHDETIQYHSRVSVPDALTMTLKWAREIGKRVVVKGHPVNPASMAQLRQITDDYGQTYVDDVSILSCLKKAESVFLVNSGVGFEAILQGKPVFQFGESEYGQVVNKITDDNIVYNLDVDMNKYRRFINTFFARAIDSSKL